MYVPMKLTYKLYSGNQELAPLFFFNEVQNIISSMCIFFFNQTMFEIELFFVGIGEGGVIGIFHAH